MRAQARLDVGVQDAEAPDHSAVPVGEKRDPDAVFLRELPQRFLGIVTDRGDAESAFLNHRTRFFQLDQLGSAVASPIRASVKNKEQSVGTREIRDGPRNAFLIRKREIGYALPGRWAGGVAIVGGVYVLRLQLGGDGQSRGAKPSELPHDRGFFLEILWGVVRHGQSSAVNIPPLRRRQSGYRHMSRKPSVDRCPEEKWRQE